jgi:uncharacterized protein YjgD (DUF1641 family)
MAKAIRRIDKAVPNPAEEQEQGMQEVMQALADSKDAVKLFLSILKEAHNAGLLELLSGLLKARHEVGYLAMKQLNQPNMHHTMKNAMGAMNLLGKIDPNQLETLLNGVARGLQRSSQPADEGQSVGIWGLAKTLRDPEINAAMHIALEFAKGFGEQIRNAPPAHQ